MASSGPTQYGDFRGSRKRIRKIKVRGNTPRPFVLWAALIAIVFFGAVLWMLNHPDRH
jgi:hypothetical protein